MKNHFLMQGLYPVGIAGSYSAGRVVQAPFGENRTYDQSYYIMKMELAKGKRSRDGPVQVLYRPHRSSVSQERNKKESRQLATLPHFRSVLVGACGAPNPAGNEYGKREVIYVFANIPYLLVLHRPHKLGGHNCR